MTMQIFYQDAYQQQLDATVTAAEQVWIELDRTIFYPMGGGQPGDRGVFIAADGRELPVIDTRKGEGDGSVRHQLATVDHHLHPGDPITARIDWERRYRLMRMHTSMHLLSSLIPVEVTGGSVGEEKSRLDFNLGDFQIDKEDLTRKLNELIQAAHPIEIGTIREAELDENPELVRTMSVQPPRGSGEIRMVRIKDVDYQACGGTHLHNTGEIGALRVVKIENKGKRNRRVHLVLD
jgi:misacylated tRNA(Ala) deacylase